MPNVTLFISQDKMPSEETLTTLTQECTALCTDLLGAALDKVHIIYVAVRHGRGHPVFAEIQFRLEVFRTAPVMEKFMEEIGDSIKRNTDLSARIRCFGYPTENIHARN